MGLLLDCSRPDGPLTAGLNPGFIPATTGRPDAEPERPDIEIRALAFLRLPRDGLHRWGIGRTPFDTFRIAAFSSRQARALTTGQIGFRAASPPGSGPAVTPAFLVRRVILVTRGVCAATTRKRAVSLGLNGRTHRFTARLRRRVVLPSQRNFLRHACLLLAPDVAAGDADLGHVTVLRTVWTAVPSSWLLRDASARPCTAPSASRSAAA